MAMWAFVACAIPLLFAPCSGHGHMTLPSSTRHGGSLQTGGSCTGGQCLWFSNNVEIPGQPTLPNAFRTVEPNITTLPQDVFRKAPWRAPGTAPVFGTGCGVAGGGPHSYPNGGIPPPGIKQGLDGTDLPRVGNEYWSLGSEVEVAWAISANHGGGYSYRLCKSDGNVTEECFQRNTLKFVGDKSWLAFSNGTRIEFTNTKVTKGVHPAGSEWLMDPVPACRNGSMYDSCGAPVEPGPSPGNREWQHQYFCYAAADGGTSEVCHGPTQFPEPVPGISGYGKVAWKWSIVDKVLVPSHLEAGRYLLSWRWDCEESTQVWQNCADVTLVDGPAPAPAPVPTPTPPAPVPVPPKGKACKNYVNAQCKGTPFQDRASCFRSGCSKCSDNSTYSCDTCCDGCTLKSKGDYKYCDLFPNEERGEESSPCGEEVIV